AICARCCLGQTVAASERACRTRRSDLGDAELLVGLMVDVQIEAALLYVELLGAVHVRYRNQHDLELVIHGALSTVTAAGRGEIDVRDLPVAAATSQAVHLIAGPPQPARALLFGRTIH